jgi:hypothetical protein
MTIDELNKANKLKEEIRVLTFTLGDLKNISIEKLTIAPKGSYNGIFPLNNYTAETIKTIMMNEYQAKIDALQEEFDNL